MLFFIGVREVPADVREKVAVVEETIKETLCISTFIYVSNIFLS